MAIAYDTSSHHANKSLPTAEGQCTNSDAAKWSVAQKLAKEKALMLQ